jgi:N-acetyl-gamma-glutamyl-phosphate reductase
MISIGVLGGSGYTGKKLLQFCTKHPHVKEITIYGNTTAGKTIADVFPELDSIVKNSVIKSVDNISLEHDLYFAALPHGQALNYVPNLISAGKKVIDLGGDYRLDDPLVYQEWYKIEHTSPELLSEKIYGLADFSKVNYSTHNLIANPGCFPTATLLPLLPVVKYFNQDILSISTIAYSGTSGAGKSPKSNMLMSEMYGNARAYNVNNHRHQPEIKQELAKAGLNKPFSFTTHLLPVAVGIYATTSVHLEKPISMEGIKNAFAKTYNNAAFIRLRETPPDLTWTVGTNFCDIFYSVKEKSLIIASTIDNLVKGASGQAVQNMNKMFGWDEHTGLL